MGKTFFGIYLGLVIDNRDPLEMMRIRAEVPEMGAIATSWALPCVPVKSEAIPDVGQSVWVMFANGDPDNPVWMGVLPRMAPPPGVTL